MYLGLFLVGCRDLIWWGDTDTGIYTDIYILILILSSFSWDFLAPTNVDGCASAGIPSILGLKICEKLIATGS